MVAYLGQNNLLYIMAWHNLINKVSSSWFLTLRTMAARYSLPDPLHILLVPPNKAAYKSMVWSYISSYWSEHLSAMAATMSSLKLLKTQSLPLGQGPHPMFTTCHSLHQAQIATIKAKMISGTYRTCYWS